jgi:hypothetical protein
LATPLGDDGHIVIVEAVRGIVVIAGSREAAMGDLKGMKAALDGAGINTDNVIRVDMEDLSERDENNLELELQ